MHQPPSVPVSSLVWVLLITVMVGVGGWLRFVHLDARPVHTDEGVNGLIEGELLETGKYRFDPKHYHGPLLHYLVVPAAWVRGERTTADLRIETPRMVTAFFGTLSILLPLMFRRTIGLRAAALGGAAIALSPMLVYYSRYSIHETVFVALSFVFLGANWHWLRGGTIRWAVAAGAAAGLMHASKESSAISWLAAFCASFAVLWVSDAARRRAMFRRDVHTLGWGLLAGLAVSLTLYSAFFQHWRGALDSITAIFVFEPVPGHEKPWSYYFGGFWPWGRGMVGTTEWPIVLAALPALFCLRGSGDRASCVRYLWIYAAALAAVYATIAYKTPWLALGFYQALAVLAGVGIDQCLRGPRWIKTCAVVLALAGAVVLGRSAWTTAVPLAASDRNPYSYSATAPGLERTARRLRTLSRQQQHLVIAAVDDYWPLPWYLRGMDNVGYWPDAASAEGVSADIWIATAKEAVPLAERLGAEFRPEIVGLRMDTPVYVFIRESVWRPWISTAREK